MARHGPARAEEEQAVRTGEESFIRERAHTDDFLRLCYRL